VLPVPTNATIPPAPLTRRQVRLILAGLLIGLFLGALDQTIVSTAIRTIADDLGGLSEQALVTTAYLITSTVTTPLYGKLSDVLGRRPLFLAAISIFVVGSLACSAATSIDQLAAFRAVQGIGAGGLFSLALTILGDIVAPRERAEYQGWFIAVFGTSSVLGPVAGGFFAGQPELLGITGWRWVFLVNVPLGLLALVVVARVLHVPTVLRGGRVDWWGAAALVAGLGPLLVLAEQGRTWGWGSPASVACSVVGAAGVALFLVAEIRAGDDALLPPRLFRSSVFGWGAATGFVAGAGMFGAVALLPLYLQVVRGSTPTAAGLQTLPLVLGIMVMSVLSGRAISRTGRYKAWIVTGLALLVLGIGALSSVGVDTPYWRVAAVMVVTGLGLGATMQPLTLAVQNAVPPQDLGTATASTTFFRQIGGTLGTAVLLSVLFGTLGPNVADELRSAAASADVRAALADPAVVADAADAPVVDALRSGTAPSLDDSSFLARADPRLARPVLDGFADSLGGAFLAAALVLVLGLGTALLMRELPLRTQSALDALRTQSAFDALRADASRPADDGAAGEDRSPGR
jgi:EmrB/QacA subfamily drug resistance transporter